MADTQSTETMMVGNKAIPIKIAEIDIFDLDYYPQNPRINYVLSKMGEGLDQKTIEESLWKLDSTKELAEDIRKNGGLIEEVLVMGNQVVEGNSRLCAYRHLYKNTPDEQKAKWKRIRAKVILTQIDSQDLFLLLGKLHIKGKTEWDPYEKASYIYKMMEENGMTIDEVGQIVGMSPSTIRTQIKAYELMKDGYLPKLSRLADEKAELKKFSIFEEYFKSSDLQNLTREQPDVLSDEKFIAWVLDQRVRSAAYDVKKDLPNILKSKRARKVFLQSPPEDAIQAAKDVVFADRPETADSFFAKLKQMTDFLKNTPPLRVKEKIEGNSRKIDLIKQFHSEVNKFYKNLELDDPNKEYIERLRQK